VEKVSITPRGRALGATLLTQETDQHLRTQAQLKDQLEMLLGGRAAEELMLGDTSTGAADDLKHASRLAYRMAGEFGFSAELGAFNYLALLPEGPSKPLEAAVVSEARQIVLDAGQRALERLREHRAALASLVEALLEYETVSGTLVSEILKRPQVSVSEHTAGAELALTFAPAETNAPSA
jgi:cell division protease FtsH